MSSHGAPGRCSAKGRDRRIPSPVPAQRSCHGRAGLRDRSQAHLDDAEDFRNVYSFFFYSNDHAPIHVHVRRGGGEAVFVVDPEVELRESVGFNVRELSRAEDLIDDHLELIKQKWAEHLG
jgi:hypothetical protein